MIEPKIYIAKAARNLDDTFSLGETVEIQEHFKGAYYNAVDGLETYGTPRSYTESFPESKSIDVYFPENTTYEATDFTLKLYFFDPENKTDEIEAIANVDKAYHAFVDYITGGYVKFWDNVRQRKVMLAFLESTKPTTDKLYGLVYKEVSFKFKNIYGRSFPLDSEEF